MDLTEVVKLVIGPIAAFILGRMTKQTDATGDHTVRLAVFSEKLESLKDRVAVLERNDMSQWKRIDSIEKVSKCNP